MLDLYKYNPELINQDVLPIILSQNQCKQNDKIIKKIKNEMKKQKEESNKMNRRYRKLMKSRKSVKQMAQEYEDNIIAPPPEFQDRPQIDDIIPPPPEFQDEIQMANFNKAFKGAVRSYEVSIEVSMTKTRCYNSMVLARRSRIILNNY